MNPIIQAALAEVEAATEVKPRKFRVAGSLRTSGFSMVLKPNGSGICDLCSEAEAQTIATALNSHTASLQLAALAEEIDEYLTRNDGLNSIGAKSIFHMQIRSAVEFLLSTLDRENGE